jgi:hypothetical protein
MSGPVQLNRPARPAGAPTVRFRPGGPSKTFAPQIADGHRTEAGWPRPPTQHHPEAAAGNPDASRSFAGRASDHSAPRGSRDRVGSPGSVGQRRAGPDAGLPARSCRRSKSGHGHNSCKRAPERGSGHTQTAGPAFPPDQRRPGMDDVRNGWNTPPACVLGTVWGTASNPDLAV